MQKIFLSLIILNLTFLPIYEEIHMTNLDKFITILKGGPGSGRRPYRTTGDQSGQCKEKAQRRHEERSVSILNRYKGQLTKDQMQAKADALKEELRTYKREVDDCST